jgi:hypothetical protein
MANPGCYLAFAPDPSIVQLPMAYHTHDPKFLGEIPNEIVVPTETCVTIPGVNRVYYDTSTATLLIVPIGGADEQKE